MGLTVVVQQLVNEVDVRQKHAAAAIPNELELVQGLAVKDVNEGHRRTVNVHLPFFIPCLKKHEILLPFVTHNLPTSEASHRDDHGSALTAQRVRNAATISTGEQQLLS